MSHTKASVSHFPLPFFRTKSFFERSGCMKSFFGNTKRASKDSRAACARHPLIMLRSFSSQPRIGTNGWVAVLTSRSCQFFAGSLAQKLLFCIFTFQFLREVSHESFGFTSSTFSFVFTSSTVTFWEKSGTKALFSHLRLSVLEGCPTRKRRFHTFNFPIFEGSLARN